MSADDANLSTATAERPQPVATDRLGTRVARASLALLTRQALVFLAGLVGSILLARRLAPEVFGAYVIASTVFVFLTLAGDLGLATSLVRQPDEPDRHQLRSVLTIQCMLGGMLAGVLALVGPVVADAAGAPAGVDDLSRFVAGGLLLASMRSTANAQLERALRFSAIGVVNVVEALIFNGTAVVLAYRGLGVRSFGIALVAEAAFGLVATVALTGRPLVPTRRPQGIRVRLGFGLAVLGSSAVSVIKDAVSPVFIGFLLGARDVGLVEWAVTFAAYPLVAAMVLQRAFLPAFARLQTDATRLVKAVEAVLYATSLFTLPLAVTTLILAPRLTPAVFGEQWVPALPVFYLLWMANIGVPIAAPLSALLTALGDGKAVLRYSVLWMTATWLLTVPLVLLLGRLGFGIANVLVQLSAVPFIRYARRQVPFRVAEPLRGLWFCSAAFGACLLGVTAVVRPVGIVAVAALGLGGLTGFGALVMAFQKERVRVLVSTVRGLAVVPA